VAAEFKRASPSKGDIALHLKVGEQAALYASAGVAVVSVLTEERHFKGSLEDMLEARRSVQALPDRPAILRKDFLIHPYQVLEARAYGADTLLLIVAILEVEELVALLAECRRLGMEPLVEVANEAEMDIALDAGARRIGVNNRNLHTFKLDLGTTTRLTAMVEARGRLAGGECLVAALSGITSNEEVLRYGGDGVKAILVGEALMRSGDPVAAIQALLGAAEVAPGGESHVKVCGITEQESALAACRAGASMIGIIFAKSPRTVTPEQASAVAGAVR